MSDSRLKVKSLQVKDIFNTMNYDKQVQNTDLAKAWLRQHNCVCVAQSNNETPIGTSTVINDLYNENISVAIYTPEYKEIASLIVGKTSQAWAIVGTLERIRIINKFVTEIEANTELICQVELLMRGVLPKDTKAHGIKCTVDYLLYYSSWAFEFKKSQNLKGTVAAIISDGNSLGTLGYVLALTLASGCTLVLQTGPKISVCASLIVQLAIKTGIPADAIKIIPGPIHPKGILSIEIGTVYIFDNLYAYNYSDLEIHSSNKIVALANLKTSAIVFNNADLDSACNSIINAAWEYQGLLPWSIDTIFIQEDVFQNFIDKFRDKLGKLRMGKGLEEPVDVSCPSSDSAAQKLQQMIDTARSQGIEVYQFPQGDDIGFKLTVFVGARVYRNNVIIENINDIPSVTLLPFRTASEAVFLANNTRQGLAASIWSQDVDLVNEVAQNLEIGTVWVNCYGIVRADVSFEPKKGSGLGYFGGPEGFYEYIDAIPITICDTENQPSAVAKHAVAAARRAQQTWAKLPMSSRIQTLSKWALEIDDKKVQWKESGLNPELWIASIYSSFKELARPGSSTSYDGKYYLRTHHEPLGIVVLSSANEDSAFIKTVTGALLLGNFVIVVSDEKNSPLPSHLLFICAKAHFYDLVNHRDVGAVISKTSPRATRLVSFRKIYAWKDDWNFVLRRTTQVKNVWLTAGDSLLNL